VGGHGGVERGEAANLPSSALLDFGKIQLEQVVDPCHEFLSAKAR
jgi:hypothetical protein